MKIKLTLFLCLFYITNIFSQNIASYNTIYNEKIYKAYYNSSICAPAFVIYKLYKGGGTCSRKNMEFKELPNIKHFNYSKSGYDKGHLANAEDFAYDSKLECITFYYINCVPQTVKLNRGIWKRFETEIRRVSQNDSLLIICGGCDWQNNIPQKCFNVVYSLSSHKLLYSLLFNNDNSDSYFNNVSALYRKLTYEYIYNLYN